MYAYKDFLELAGYTTRLYTLLSSLHNLPPLPPVSSDALNDTSVELRNVDVGIPAVSLAIPAAASITSSASQSPLDLRAVPPAEKAASSWILVKNLSLSLKEGEHLMITGSNGVGKTAIARVLAGLWATQSGEVRRPAGLQGMFVVPQRSYMVTGSLLDQ